MLELSDPGGRGTDPAETGASGETALCRGLEYKYYILFENIECNIDNYF